MNTIEPSKSSRATCRSCKSKISKGNARLGVETEFSMDGDTFTSKKWHHLECGMENIPDAVLTAEIVEEVTSRGKPLQLSEEDIESVKEFREKYNKAGMAVISIADVEDGGKTVNIEAEVLRAMSPRTMENPEGKETKGMTVYVEEDGHRSKILLWDEHVDTALQKEDRLVVLEAISELASNDNIQFHATKRSVVLVNPTDEELEEHGEEIELYVSQEWKRPTGQPAEFTYAPSGRASCGVCGKKISKGELKLVKPRYIELDNGRTVPGNTSYHLKCMIEDEDGLEVLHEAATRLSLDMIDENRAELTDLEDSLPASDAKSVLKAIL